MPSFQLSSIRPEISYIQFFVGSHYSTLSDIRFGHPPGNVGPFLIVDWPIYLFIYWGVFRTVHSSQMFPKGEL